MAAARSDQCGGRTVSSDRRLVVVLILLSARLKAVDLIRLGVCALLGLMAIRNGLWWSMAAAPPLASLLAPLRTKLARTEASDPPKRAHWIVIVVVVVLLVLASPWTRSLSPLIPARQRALVANFDTCSRGRLPPSPYAGGQHVQQPILWKLLRMGYPGPRHLHRLPHRALLATIVQGLHRVDDDQTWGGRTS